MSTWKIEGGFGRVSWEDSLPTIEQLPVPENLEIYFQNVLDETDVSREPISDFSDLDKKNQVYILLTNFFLLLRAIVAAKEHNTINQISVPLNNALFEVVRKAEDADFTSKFIVEGQEFITDS